MRASRPLSTDPTDDRRELLAGQCIVSWLVLRDRRNHIHGRGAGDLLGKLGIFHCSAYSEGLGTSGGCGEGDILIDLGRWPETGCIVRARRIGRQAGNAALVCELLDLLHIQIQCLASQVAVRGAVAIGYLHRGPNGADRLSGPALSSARDMEREKVFLPLIAVAEEIVGRLRSDDSLWAAEHGLRSEMDIIEEMMTTDEAGLHCIDYLRAGLGDFAYDFDRYAEFLERHRRFVETGLAGVTHMQDSHTYRWLKHYHNARIDDDISPPERGAASECGRAMARVLEPLRIP